MENPRFKFRVWSIKHNRYIVDSHYPIGSDYIIVIKQDGKVYNLGLGDYEDDSNIMHSWGVIEEFADCILEQCTGLKDKNGNLIYEGDIIKVPDDWETYGAMSNEEREVYFRDGGFRLKPTNTKVFRGYWLEQADDLEIIGNIHEQAEQKN